MLGKSPIFPLKLYFCYPSIHGDIADLLCAVMCSKAFMYGLLVSPYSTRILAGKTEELYALCRQETVLSGTPLTRHPLEVQMKPSTEVGFVTGRIPYFCKPPSG